MYSMTKDSVLVNRAEIPLIGLYYKAREVYFLEC